MFRLDGRAQPAAAQPRGVTMAVTVPAGPVIEGVRSLEVRWILPGQLDMAVAGWFDRSRPEMESREDAYLLDPDLGGLSVKVRAGRALEVKAFRGSAGTLDLPGRARGRMQYWQKWSFPFRPLSQNSGGPGRLETGTSTTANLPVLANRRANHGVRP